MHCAVMARNASDTAAFKLSLAAQLNADVRIRTPMVPRVLPAGFQRQLRYRAELVPPPPPPTAIAVAASRERIAAVATEDLQPLVEAAVAKELARPDNLSIRTIALNVQAAIKASGMQVTLAAVMAHVRAVADHSNGRWRVKGAAAPPDVEKKRPRHELVEQSAGPSTRTLGGAAGSMDFPSADGLEKCHACANPIRAGMVFRCSFCASPFHGKCLPSIPSRVDAWLCVYCVAHKREYSVVRPILSIARVLF